MGKTLILAPENGKPFDGFSESDRNNEIQNDVHITLDFACIFCVYWLKYLKEEVVKLAKQSQTDKKGSGAGKKTLWELVKYTMVSMLAMVVSFGTLNIFIHLPFIRDLFDTSFGWFVFDYPIISSPAGVILSGGLGYFIAFNTSNTLAQIVAFFVNRDKTFKSSANIAITLPIYIAFTLALICFSAWLSPQLNGFLMGKTYFGIEIGEGLAANIANMACSFVQFILYFPADKILFRKPKAEKAA